jgi:hypothetical protein
MVESPERAAVWVKFCVLQWSTNAAIKTLQCSEQRSIGLEFFFSKMRTIVRELKRGGHEEGITLQLLKKIVVNYGMPGG